MVLEGMRREVAAESCGMDRQTLRDWNYRYNAEDVEGLGKGVIFSWQMNFFIIL